MTHKRSNLRKLFVGRTVARRLALLTLLPVLVLAGCAPLVSDGIDRDALATQIVQTIVAQITPTVVVPSPTPEPPTATPTEVPTEVPPTAVPVTVVPTSPPAQPTSVPPVSSVPCDWAQFVADIQISDGTQLNPGASFTKIWRLKNIGTCTWTSNYQLVYVSGDRMSGAQSVSIGRSVAPGQTIDLALTLKAPSEPGKYTGYWALRTPAGRIFGIGDKATGSFWVSVVVRKPVKLVYDFGANFCDATWASGAGALSCPGADGDASCFVIRVNSPILEGGRRENEAGLWMSPQAVNDGWITGTYPLWVVKDGDRFRAVIACLDGYPDCNVRFRLAYQKRNGVIRELATWNEKVNGQFQVIDYDLSGLAGMEIHFILSVEARGSSDDDAALWLMPSIWR